MGRQQQAASYRGYRTAGIRLTEELEPDLAPHRERARTPEARGSREFNLAHVVMLAERELLSPPHAAALLSTLREQAQAGEGGLHADETALIRALGEDVGGRLHLGRSSGDVGGVRLRWALRESILDLVDALNTLRGSLLRQGRAHIHTVMPGYTQGQHAQPTTFGHWLSMWANVAERDARRFTDGYRDVDRSPAGAAILAGTSAPIDRQRTSDLLGFAEPLPHTFDAIQSHDTVVEVAGALANHLAGLSRFAGDLMLWSSAEFGFLRFPDRFCGTSSVMMQKRNPYLLAQARELAARAAAAHGTALRLSADPTGWSVLEWSALHGELLDVFAEAATRLGQLARLIDATTVYADRMAAAAAAHWAQATDVAMALVEWHGIAWRTAHQIVGILVRHSEEQGWTPPELANEHLRAAAAEYFDRPLDLPEDVLAAAKDPASSVAARTVLGGPAPEPALSELDQLSGGLARDRDWAAGRRAALRDADERRHAAADAVIADGSRHV
ncbi:lyase family protein [Phytohabitans kaempferiae]|uniref:argininosuccinate lyase n=1 Tax=Phytohabitans kaempferiae TaxID=1620943 RepID=A0ABV6M3B3_9ACTN